MGDSKSTRAFLRSLIRDVRYLTEGDNGKRPVLADLLIRAEG